MQLLSGQVKYPAGKVVDGEWGARQNIVVKLDNGEEEKLWFPAGRQPHTLLRKGDRVQILIEQRDGKTVRRLLEDGSHPSPSNSNGNGNGNGGAIAPTPNKAELSPELKREIAAYIEARAAMLRFCFDQAAVKFPELDAGQHKEVATTLFIAVQRAYNI